MDQTEAPETQSKIAGLDTKVFIFLVTQAIAIIIWAANLSATVNYQSAQIHELKAAVSSGSDDRYRGTDAARDLQRVYSTIDSALRRIESLEARARTFDGKSP